MLIHREYGFTAKALDDAKRSVDVVASTDAVDAYGEVVVADWDLRRFVKSPSVFWGHRTDQLPIGHASDVRVDGGKLLATINFVDAAANDLAEKVWQGVRQGSIRAVSVGFRSKKAEPKEIDGRTIYHLSGNELLELSVVGVGANPEATIESVKELRYIRELAGAADPTTPLHARIKELEADVARLTPPAPTAEEAREREEIIARVQRERRLAPALLGWARGVTLSSLRTFAESAPVIEALRIGPKEPGPTEAGLTWKGKRFGDLKPSEKHDLYLKDRELYEAMKDMEANHG